MNLTQIAAAVAFALGLTIGGVGAWKWQESRVASAQMELKNERIAQERAARTAIERTTSAVITAQNEAVARVAAAAADLDHNRSELERLRVASDNAMRAAAASLDACIVATHAYDQLSTQCAARLVEVARNADGHVSDIKTLSFAWPK